jgi:hypothetical protein
VGVLLKTVDPTIERPRRNKQALGRFGHVVTGIQPEQRLGALEGSGVMGTAGHRQQLLIFFVGKDYTSHRGVLGLYMAINDSL